MQMRKVRGIVAVVALALIASHADAQEKIATQKIATGAINSPSPLGWPFYIALGKGMFAAKGLALDVTYTNSAPNLLQQTSAGSIDFAMSTGLVDPIRAIDKGGPVSIVLVEVVAAPYELMGKAAVKNLAGLKGKNIAVGGLNDITNIYLDRMVAPSGLKRGDFDMQFFGSTPAHSDVVLVRVERGGHVEPSLAHRYRSLYLHIVGPQSSAFESAQFAWDFFRDKSRAPAMTTH